MTSKDPMEFLDKFGLPNSVYPPTKHLTFGPWIFMVPQYKPENILMLGYAGGTTAGLIRLLYGNVPITAVDIEPCSNFYGVDLIQADAQEYVKTCNHFDCVIVDLFPNDKKGICDFILTKEFVLDIKRIANYIIVNTANDVDMKEYKVFRKMGVNKPTKLENLIYYFANKEIPNLNLRLV